MIQTEPRFLNRTNSNSFRTESKFFSKIEPKLNQNEKSIPHIPINRWCYDENSCTCHRVVL